MKRYVYFIALIHHVEKKKERNPAIFRYFLAVSGNRWERIIYELLWRLIVW